MHIKASNKLNIVKNAALLVLFIGAIFSPRIIFPQPLFAQPVANDRWLEMDLYWFDAENPETSAEKFWQRYHPLYQNIDGYKGVILNLAMTVNYIMEYKSGLNQEIYFPKSTGQELGAPITGQLHGTSAQRQAAWRSRFKGADNHHSQMAYGTWRYGQVKALIAAMKAKAEKYGVTDFRVGSLIVGQDGTYGEPTPFAQSHPEAWTKWPQDAAGSIASSSHFDPSAKLHANPTPRIGLPDGFSENMPVHAAFAAQWGALSRDIGLEALMLRDSISFPRAYTRYGPYGEILPDNDTAERHTTSLAALIRQSKQANPNALIMMYSSAATATADWRANGIDVERIANEGFLDIFVDQTWAGAWNEVGVRQQTYWNAPILGWTYQLSYMMQHAAALSKTKVRHYFLTDTFDAWESWDTLHSAPEKLRWAIWAYSHISVKTPTGLRHPAGSYISWGNRGAELFSEQDVAFLSNELNAAARDAQNMTEIFGPTLVYSREIAAAQVQNRTYKGDLRDRIDEQMGSAIKWPVPILSITRLEWLNQVQSPLFIFGTTRPLSDAQIAPILTKAQSGQAMAFWGSFGGALHPKLQQLMGITTQNYAPKVQDRILNASLGQLGSNLPLANFSHDFSAPPPLWDNRAAPDNMLYSFGDNAAMVRVTDETRNIDMLAWDAPPLADYWFRPLRDNMHGDESAYALAAAALTVQLAQHSGAQQEQQQPYAAIIDRLQTMNFTAWRGKDSKISLLFGNLEEGLRDDANRIRKMHLTLPLNWHNEQWQTRWKDNSKASKNANNLSVDLAPQGSLLLQSQ